MPLLLNKVYEKSATENVPWSQSIHYTFQEHDASHSTQEYRAYRIPYSNGVFWTDFRVTAFHSNGVAYTDPISVQLCIYTADGSYHSIFPQQKYTPQRWWSTRWPLPSLPFTAPCGIWMYLWTGGVDSYHVELRGFQTMYPESDRYVFIDEEDKRHYLFQQERPVASSEENARYIPVGTIHDIYSDGQDATHGLLSEAVDGIPLFPIWKYQSPIYHNQKE